MPAEELEQSPIGVAEEHLPLRSDSEAGRGDARFAHALRAERTAHRRPRQQAVAHEHEIHARRITAREPYDRDTAARVHHALDNPSATKRLIVRVRRDDEERGAGT